MSLYSQIILEHYKYPQNKGKIDIPDCELENVNRSCWDEIIVYLKLDKNKKKIKEIKFEASGCAISVATASLLSEELIWIDVKEVFKMEIVDIEELLWTKIWANRIKCAVLALRTIQECLKK